MVYDEWRWNAWVAMAGGRGRDEKFEGSGHAELDILYEAWKPTKILWEEPEDTPLAKAIRVCAGERGTHFTRSSVVAVPYRLGLMLGELVTELFLLVAEQMLGPWSSEILGSN